SGDFSSANADDKSSPNAHTVSKNLLMLTLPSLGTLYESVASFLPIRAPQRVYRATSLIPRASAEGDDWLQGDCTACGRVAWHRAKSILRQPKYNKHYIGLWKGEHS